MLKLERRAEPSATMRVASPLLAALAMLATGFVVFLLLGKDPVEAFYVFFVKPVATRYGLGELLLKATPLILCALGFALGFRANVWNIGAEGQYIVGALGASWVAMRAGEATSAAAILPAIVLAGVLAGAAWAAIVAFLRDRWNANEILVSLMLVYVAEMLLGYLTYGPWKDPEGFNFPQTITFLPATQIPLLAEGHRAHAGLFVALVAALSLLGSAFSFSQK